MNLKTRVAMLEEAFREQLAEQNVMGLLIQAVISSAPDRPRIAAAFDMAVARYERNAADQGFELAHDPQILKNLLDRMRPRIDRLRTQLQKP